MPQIVPLDVGPIGGELSAVSEERAPMQPAQETLNYRPGHQRQVAQRVQQPRFDDRVVGHGVSFRRRARRSAASR